MQLNTKLTVLLAVLATLVGTTTAECDVADSCVSVGRAQVPDVLVT